MKQKQKSFDRQMNQIGIGSEDVSALVAPAHDVIEHPFIFQSEFPSHSQEESRFSLTGQYQEPTP